MIGMASAELRYMQISITAEAGSHLPGLALTDSFSCIEFLSHINTVDGNMRCLLRLEYEDESTLDASFVSLDILEIIERSPTAALVEADTQAAKPASFGSPPGI